MGTVAFPHADHVKRLGKEACGTCHHLHKPGDVGTPCSECHSDLYLSTMIFDHLRHVRALGENESCAKCHPEGRPQVGETARKCSECHQKDMMARNDVVTKFESLTAPGLRKAAHGICIDCHRREATNPEWKKPDLFRCATCHGTPVPHGKAVLEASLEAQQD
jgi:hypothetical protein